MLLSSLCFGRILFFRTLSPGRWNRSNDISGASILFQGLQNASSRVLCRTNKSQCDEGKPVCNNCQKRERECVYDRDSGRSRTSMSPGYSQSSTLIHTRPEWYYEDFALLHHFIRYTSDELGPAHFWKNELLDISLRNRSIYHLMLCLSAYHLSSLRQQEATKHIGAAAEHYTLGVPPLLTYLRERDRSSLEALIPATVIICLIGLAKGPEPGQFLAFSDQGPGEWLTLLNGVKSVVEHHPGILGDDASMTGGANIYKSPTLASYKRILADLDAFLSAASFLKHGITQIYKEELEKLSDCYVAKFEGPESCKDERSNAVMSWVFCMPTTFRQALENKDALALIIYAHFPVLLIELNRKWPFRGWPVHILQGIRKHLPEEYSSWLRWPEQMINRSDELEANN